MMPINEIPLISDHDLLIRLDAKLDQFIHAQDDHEARLRVVESTRDQLNGSIRTLKGIISFIGLLAAIAAALGTWSLMK
jgi:hypothetical protein